MKIIYAVPPIKTDKGYPTCGQNRNFQFFKDPFYAYPILPALALTMLHQAGYHCTLIDCVAEGLHDAQFAQQLIKINPDYIIFEAQTPLIKRYWEIIAGIKQYLPRIKVILCGEHISILPEESQRCGADFIVQGGKWFIEVFKLITGKEFDKPLPHIDRDLTKWWLYAYKNGNFKYIPATYIQSAFDCFYGKCTFCSWAHYHNKYILRPAEDVLLEIEELIEFGFKEIFDDSGTLPVGEWLKTLCEEIIKRGYNKYVSFGCNMRFGALTKEEFVLLGKAGFRMVLFGLESIHEKTLLLLNKGTKPEQFLIDLKNAKDVGVQSHLTVMFGYPWESFDEAKKTASFVRGLLLSGLAFSAQATICIPYPNTLLWRMCNDNKLLTSVDWDLYDMQKPIMIVPYPEKELFKLQKSIYDVSYHPRFIWNKLKMIRSWEDVSYYLRTGRKIYDRFGNFTVQGKVAVD